jgi:hypothetical protein
MQIWQGGRIFRRDRDNLVFLLYFGAITLIDQNKDAFRIQTIK